jgi:hypothetical protein
MAFFQYFQNNVKVVHIWLSRRTSTQIDKMNINKATDKDGISVKILKIAKPIVSKPITRSISTAAVY